MKFPERLVCALNPDGTVRGHHIEYLHRFTDPDTGEVFDRPGGAIPVGDAAAAIPLQVALGEIGAALAVAEEVERGRRAEAEAARETAIAERDEARRERDEARRERDAARAPRATARKSK